MITVAVINKSTALSDANVAAAVPGLQVQVSRDFALIWGVDANLVFVGQGQQPPPNAWQLIVLDDSDQAGALGYHELKTGLPIGYVFARTDLQAGLNWTVTCSHELLEMLADPYVMCTVLVPSHGFRHPAMLLAQEVCDAPEADQFAYNIVVDGPNGTKYNVAVSDFVTPAWFGAPLPPGGKYSFMGHCTQPFQILTGGYIGAMTIRGAGQWTQITGRQEEQKWTCHQMQADGLLVPISPPVGSRRERRARLKQHTAQVAMLGLVRNDLDQLIQHAEGSLHGMDNAVGWLSNLLAGVMQGKSKIRVGWEDAPAGFSVWLEPKA